MLDAANFNVLQAESGAHAIEIAGSYSGKIDLFLSDVQMPEMSGPALGMALKASRPDLRVILLVLNYGWAFIEKPFLTTTLLDIIDVVLHTPDKSQSSDRYDTRGDIVSAE